MISAPSTAREPSSAPAQETSAGWDTELFLVSAADRRGLVGRIEGLRNHLARQPSANLVELACALNTQSALEASRLAVVARSIADLDQKLQRAAVRLADPACRQINDASGIHFCERPLYPEGKLAVLFPGEGAQYPHMLADLRDKFSEVGQWLDWAASAAAAAGGDADVYLEKFGAFDESRALGDVMCSVLVADWALYELLRRFSVQPHAVAGHSIGELAALFAAGCLDTDLSIIGEIRATMQSLQDQEIAGQGETVLLAVGASREALNELIGRVEASCSERLGVYVAMDNCPHQTVLVGLPAGVARIEAELLARSVMHERLPFGRPYHTPQFEPFMGPLTRMFDNTQFHPPHTPVYSCTTSHPFPESPEAIRKLAWQHWAAPVEFTATIRAMHDDGVRIFVEAGPRGNLTAFVEDILRGREFLAVSSNMPRRSGITQLNHLLGQLAVHHVPLTLDHLYAGRVPATGSNEPPVPAGDHAPGRAAVLAEYFNVMEQFLDAQRDVMEEFLHRGRGLLPNHSELSAAAIHALEAWPVAPAAPEPIPAPATAPGPLVGEIISHEVGRELLVRRRLDLAEDRYAAEHTIGGREVSHIDPEQHGLPVMPMTFTLEMMAEVASVLVPGKVALGLRNIQLLRWLAFDAGDPTSVEITARIIDGPIDAAWPDANVQVAVSVRDLGNQSSLPATGMGYAATGTVMLGDERPAAPQADKLQLSNCRQTRISLETTYTNLFHGPCFQGVMSMGAIGDEGIVSQSRVLPRAGLFASTDDPQFLFDPVLLDVGMHAVAAWHLEQPDQSGRILLPYECEYLRVYGPRPPEGAEFESRAMVTEDSQRQHTQSTDLIDCEGRLWARLKSVKCWRFYLPFGDINFHGPKDQYFLGKDWPQALPKSMNVAGPRAACVKLEPPRDLLQIGMRLVTAYVSFPPEELPEFLRLTLPEKERSNWLFTRIAAKEAIRFLWRDARNHRLFPSDILLSLAADGRPVARMRGKETPPDFPTLAWAHAGGVMAGLAAFSPHAGVALVLLEDPAADLEASMQRAAMQAVAQALAADEPDANRFEVVAIDAASGAVQVADRRDNVTYLAHTHVDKNLVVATTVGEQVER